MVVQLAGPGQSKVILTPGSASAPLLPQVSALDVPGWVVEARPDMLVFDVRTGEPTVPGPAQAEGRRLLAARQCEKAASRPASRKRTGLLLSVFRAGVAELVDAQDLGSCAFTGVGVRVPPFAFLYWLDRILRRSNGEIDCEHRAQG